jgi:hypothetical protein
MGIEAATAAGSKFVHIGFAENDGTGFFEPLDHGGIFFGNAITVNRRADGGGIARDTGVIFNDDGHAV